MAHIIKVNWKRHTRRLAKAIFLSMTAGTMLMSQAYAQSYDKPITLDYDTDYGTAQTTGTYKNVLTKDDSDEDNIKLTYDFGKDGIVDIETNAGTKDIAPIGHGKLDAGTTISATIQAKTLNLTASTSNSGELMNGSAGIYAMSGVDLTINSDVNIKVDNRTDTGVDYFVAGIDVPMAGAKKTGITINGNLSMVGSGNDNTSDDYWGVITHAIHANGGGAGADYQGSRWAPAGLYLQGKKGSHITVNGDVNLRVKGIGVFADCYSDKAETVYNNKINLNGGDVYVETPKDSTEGYYSVASFGGTVNINMNEEETASLNHKVTLIGNIFSIADDGNGYYQGTPTFFANGKLNIGLSTADSSWTGIIDNTGAKATGVSGNTANTEGSQIGVVNLFLSNGATWNYESLGAKNGQDVATMPAPSINQYGVYDGISHVTKLTGGTDATSAGIIKIKDTDPIEIGTAEGTTKVWYDHEDGTPGTMIGGDVKVLGAKAGATMMLYTGNNGITKGLSASDAAVDKNNVSEVLNALAHKLWYLAGDTNLSGTVTIAEGLTAGSATLKMGNISFSTDSTGTKQAGQGFYDYTPETDTKVYETGPITKSENIDETRVSDVNGLVTIHVTEAQNGTLNSAPSALFASSDAESPILVDLQGHTLKLSTGGDAKKYLSTVYVNEGKTIQIKDSKGNGALKISAGVSEDGSADNKTNYTYGVYVDGGSLTASTDVEIDGVKSTGSSRAIGLYAYNGNVEFDKNLTVKNVQNNNKVGPNTVGIYADSSSNISIKGQLDIENIAGAALRAMNGSTISTSGATIKAMDMANGTANSQYYAAFANKGTINLNTGDAITAGVLDVTGDLKVSNYDTSIINMNLTKGSQWTGATYNVSSSTYNPPSGQINLTMADGSSWTHETGLSTETKKTTFAGSNISKLDGSGVIYQKADTGITVYNYSGDSTVVYDHDASDPLSITGGDFTIKAATAGSKITLVTDSKGISGGFADSDTAAERNNVKAILNKLANKLYYTSYKDGNLSGTVKIADGLTASSVSATVKASGDITFSDGTNGTKTAGQGFFDYTPEEDKPDYRTGPITGSEDISLSRETDEDGIAHVSSDTVSTASNFVSALYDGVSSSYADPMTVKLGDKGLALTAKADSTQAAGIYVGTNANINIIKSSAGKALTITSTNEDTRAAHGMYVLGNAKLNISGPVEMTDITTQGDSAAGISIQGQQSNVNIDGSLKISNVKGKRERGAGINAAGIHVIGDSSTVTVTGSVDISGVRGSGILLKGADTKVSIGGGKITAVEDADKSHNFYAARVEKGQLDINMKDGAAGSTTTQITGDMYVTGQYGKKVVEYTGGELIDWSNAGILNVALTDSSSFWKGSAVYDQYNSDYGSTGGGNTMHDIGQFNLYLQNGATWTNEQQSHGTTTTTSSAAWEGSTLATLHGGSDADHAGVIYQNDSNPISVNTYSGYTTVFYDHDENDPTNIIGGDFKITNADEGSSITLVTDSKGISSGWKDDDASEAQRNVYQVLNKLAGKLYYNSYKDGHLVGFVKIAGGLTATSTTLKMDNISFYDDSDVTSGAASEAGWGYVKDTSSSVEGDFKNTPITGDTSSSADPSQEAYKKAGILGSDGVYKFVNDTTLETTDYNAIIDAKENVTIDAAGKVLTFIGTNDTENKGYKVGVFSTNGKDITINAKKLVIDVEQSKDGGITYGINANGIDNGKWTPTNVTINGDVDITSISPAGGAYGVWARGKATVNLNGKVTMRNDGKDAEGNDIYAVDSKDTGNFFYGAAGLYVTSEWGANNYGATINADTVDFKINGNGIWTNIGGGTVNVNGGTIELKKDSPTGYAALLAECGTVNMNVIKNEQGEVIDAGNHDVVIKGNVSALTGAIHPVDKSTYSTVNLGLTTDASSLHGVIWNGFRDKGEYNDEYDEDGEHLFYGRTNLWLKNGATWTNEAWGTVDIRGQNYYGKPFAGSLVSNFHGGSDEAHTGYIFQQETRPITLQNYSGYTTVFYQHDENDPTTMIGGDLTIQKAEAGSGITLITDNKGLTKGFSTDDKASDQNQVSEVLNKLAQKLFYTANDGNLVGTVKIAEGLTAVSATLKKGNISFSTAETGTKTAGQGFYDYTPADDSVLTAKITGGNDKKYMNLGIETEKGSYTFTDDATITVTKGSYSSELGAIESSGGPITIHADGKTLDVSYTVPSGSYVARGVATGLSSYGKKDISITAGKLNLASKTSGFYGQGVYATGGTISIDADTTISTSAQTETNGIYAGSNGTVTMNGNLTIKEDTGASKYYALKADDNGTINVNVKDGKAANGVVKINSDIFTKSKESYDYWEDETTTTASTINLALKGTDTSWTGRSLYEKNTSGDDTTSYGNFNLWLEDGATWTNQKTGKDVPIGFAGSHVTSFSGNGGFIYQNDTNAITVDKYSGDTTVVYKHDIVDDTDREKAELYGNKAASIIGGDFTITNAAEGSSITLVTDRTGLNLDSDVYTDKNLISDTLDKLANKLFYTGYADGHLTGYVKIAEGLTASSITKALKSGDISYKENGQGYYAYNRATKPAQSSYEAAPITGDTSDSADPSQEIYKDTGIMQADGTYTFTKDTTITSGSYAKVVDAKNDVTINADGQTLTMIAEGPKALASAVDGDTGNNITINAKKLILKADAKTKASGGAKGYGIKTSGNGKVTINGDVDASVVGKYGAYGVHTTGSEVDINGTFTIRNDDGWAVASDGGFSFYGAAGLYATSAWGNNNKGGTINVDKVDMKLDGNGAWTNIGGGVITIGGGNIEINRENTKGYAALRAECGTINMNVVKDKDGNIVGAGDQTVTIKGNVDVNTGAINDVDKSTYTTINLGLTTSDSYLHGVYRNGFKDEGNTNTKKKFYGVSNLWLQNGAQWIHEEYGPIGENYYGELYKGSQLTNLYGGKDAEHAGIIFQENADPIAVKNYSGNTIVVYKHDIVGDTDREKAELYGNKAASIIGGDFTITNAAEGSSITLVTDRNGLNLDSDVYTDKNLISDTLDKLANKLFYTGYADGHLTGYVKIAEGLTASSITQVVKSGDISYKDGGQGYYDYDIVYPGEQVKDPMHTVIDGSDASKDAYRDAGIYKDEDDTYHFTKDPATVGSDDKSTGLIEAKDNDVNVVAKDTLKLVGKDGGVGILAENDKTSKTTGNTDITVKDGTGVLANGGHVNMTGDTTITAGTGMEAKAGGTITTTGKTNITVGTEADAVKATGEGSLISLKDGTITGQVSVAEEGKITADGTTITGDIHTASNGIVDMKAGSVTGNLISDGGTITANGTKLNGKVEAKAGTVEMTSGTVTGDVQSAGGKVHVTDTAISGILQATKGGEITMTNGTAAGITTDAESKITASLTGKEAALNGTIANEGDVTISLADGASWTGDATGKGKTTATVGKDSTWTGKSENANMSLSLSGTWQNTGASQLASLTSNGGILDMTGASGDISIGSYNGSMKALYKHNEKDPKEIYGGKVTVNAAQKGATIDLVTDSKGLKLNSFHKVDKDTVSETLNQLAHHLVYKGDAGNLTGQIRIAEGLTSGSASLRAENITFDKDGVGSYVYSPADTDLDIEYSTEETRMMKGTKSSLLGTTIMWRSNNNDVLRRMGDLRLNQGETGAWARYMTGRNKFDQQNTYLSQSYHVAQIGYDKKVSDWTVGLALDHANGKNSFNGGKAKEKMTTLAIYGTKVSDDGSYIDIIVKTGKVNNKFDVSNEVGNELHSDYDTWGTSLSMEYGKRFVKDNGFYLDPSVELTMGRLNSKDYTGTSDLGLLNVKQHAFDSAIGRIALALGKETPRSNVFAKFALAHEFGGAFKTDFFAEDGGLKSTRIDLKDTWLDVELGGTYKLNGNASIYGTFTRNFAADMTTKWRIDAGVRFTF